MSCLGECLTEKSFLCNPGKLNTLLYRSSLSFMYIVYTNFIRINTSNSTVKLYTYIKLKVLCFTKMSIILNFLCVFPCLVRFISNYYLNGRSLCSYLNLYFIMILTIGFSSLFVIKLFLSLTTISISLAKIIINMSKSNLYAYQI